MSRWIYTLVLMALMPFVLLRLCWRGLRAPAYWRRWGERFARIPGRSGDDPLLWIHAVSVGEFMVARILLPTILERWRGEVLVTTTTPTGSAQFSAWRDSLPETAQARLHHSYLPYDLPWLMRRFVARFRPAKLVIIETELWPNLLHVCASAGIPAMLVNARLSDRSARGYQRFSALTRPMLQQLQQVVAQNESSRDHFIRLGASADRVMQAGNIKFDVKPDQEQVSAARQLRQQWQRPVWVAASTHHGEDGIVLAAHRKILQRFPDALLVLVPRHPERFEAVWQQIGELGFARSRRSENLVDVGKAQVLLGDSMGEMFWYYGLADVAFVGGSLIEKGGHNMLEAAVLSLPVVTGPSLYNFPVIAAELTGCGAMVQAGDAPELADRVMTWLEDDAARHDAGQAGHDVVVANQGAAETVLQVMLAAPE